MNNVRIDDNLPQFSRGAKGNLSQALKEAAVDGLREAKDNAPFDKGGLRRESDIKQMTQKKWRIRFWEEYARFQEFGGDSQRRVEHYSTPGTGPHFLKNAGDRQAERLKRLFKKHAGRPTWI